MTAQSSRSWKKFVVLLVAFVGLPVLLCYGCDFASRYADRHERGSRRHR